MSSPSSAHAADDHLETGHLSRRSLVALSLSSFIPAVGMGLLPVLMLSLAGPTAWLSAVVAAALVVAVGRCVITFARRYVGSGSMYSYISEVFGPWARYLTAAAMIVGYVIQVGAVAATVGIFSGSFLEGRGVHSALAPGIQSVIIGGAILIAGFVAYRGVDMSVKIAVTLAAVSVPVMVVISIASAVHTGLDLSTQFDVQQFSASGALKGVAAGSAWLIGFESCAAMAAETKDPKRSVPIAIMSVPVVLGAGYIVATILQVPGLIAAQDQLAAGMSAPAVLALQGGLGSSVAAATDLLLAVACFAALIGFTNYGARIAVAMSDDGLLPAWAGRIHPRFHSPYLAIIAEQVLGFLSIMIAVLYTGNITSTYTMIAQLIVYCWIAPYVLVAVGSVVLSRRVGELSVGLVVAAVFGTVGIGWIYVNAWINPPAAPADKMVWFAVGLIAVMTALIGGRRRRLGSRSDGSPDASPVGPQELVADPGA
ncbi:APC family permease [Gordonia sp. TBRC 11910]|uniref:APC family permease n=1 Tax=Gordonia asplenii TaxID=2725283 RepID=A0A848KVZ9_9ACTN|nr:APC family permease [Gordonia asplenii]NMO02237.1 APC family permease [Gordonia asplenii]